MRTGKDQEPLFALDIGTRSLVGVVGYPEKDKIRVKAIETLPHRKRAMRDGQIEDIHAVARGAAEIKRKLEERLGCTLPRVYVAAAGRALKTCHAAFETESDQKQRIDQETISRLEAGAIANAEEKFRGEGDKDIFYLVGYSVSRYYLDNYPMTELLDHTGRKIRAEIIATFLPGQVIESLYAAMRLAGLSVAGLTLEPIAAINAAIPEKIRLLNLVLVDIGAGTSDIAACRDGSVTGYTMATTAGDEITEALMKKYLLDFDMAEKLKMDLTTMEKVSFQDILGNSMTLSSSDVLSEIDADSDTLGKEIAEKITEINGGPPSAVFLAGGGSRLKGLREKIAGQLKMEEKRVAIAGSYYQMHCICDEEIDLPEYATPLGILISAGLGLTRDNYRILLNDTPARLFGNGNLTARDILLMNGYSYRDMFGSRGRNLVLTVNGNRRVFPATEAVPAVLTINGKNAGLSERVYPGDSIHFEAARDGALPKLNAAALFHIDKESSVMINGKMEQASVLLQPGDSVEGPLRDAGPDEKPHHTAEPKREFLKVELNGRSQALEPKPDGSPYYLMDMLDRTGIDFKSLKNPAVLLVNGQDSGFQRILRNGDQIEIRIEGNRK